MFHTGYEHSCRVISQKFTDPRRLVRPLDHGLRVIAAHCGTCTLFDREDYYPGFVEMMHRYPNLYGDTSILATWPRWRALGRLAGEPESLRIRLLHGSDYPFPPSRGPYLHRAGFRPGATRNPLDIDLAIKQSFDFGPGYATRGLAWFEREPADERPVCRTSPAVATVECGSMIDSWDVEDRWSVNDGTIGEVTVAGVRTVLTVAEQFERLKQSAGILSEAASSSDRGYFTPSEDEEVRHLLVSYWQSRNALLELVLEMKDAQHIDSNFLVGFAGALVLVDAGRFLRDEFDDRPVVRGKLNEPAPHFGIPEGLYDHRAVLADQSGPHLAPLSRDEVLRREP